jgi:hypothetical protein
MIYILNFFSFGLGFGGYIKSGITDVTEFSQEKRNEKCKLVNFTGKHLPCIKKNIHRLWAIARQKALVQRVR